MWRGLVAWSLHRAVNRAAAAQYSSDKNTLLFRAPPAPFYKYSDRESTISLSALGAKVGRERRPTTCCTWRRFSVFPLLLSRPLEQPVEAVSETQETEAPAISQQAITQPVPQHQGMGKAWRIWDKGTELPSLSPILDRLAMVTHERGVWALRRLIARCSDRIAQLVVVMRMERVAVR